ncbi:MAG: hypothetical protein NT034_02750 [Candidatus Magasanikbacteria bacterium]|nr:hypothetical protein [Candidatus Magasanikbacteria bacterium]
MFIIDFDDTIFDTRALKLARLEALKTIGVSEELFWKTYKQARSDREGNFTYTDRRHAQFLAIENFDEEKIFGKLSEASQHLENFLFPDSHDFLEALKKYDQSMILLSLGDTNFQEFKLDGSKIRRYFNHVFLVSESKDNILKQIFEFKKDKEVWFINDKVKETKILWDKFPTIKPVLKISSSIPMEEYVGGGMPYFETLTEIKDYVSQSF